MSTPHNSAKPNDFAKTVLMPGDPLRAKFIADNYLKEVKQVNTVRNMLGFTGIYKGEKVSVMGSGMGMPSIGIYSYELYSFYNVDRIIRIGSAGSVSEDLDLFDIVVAEGASTNSSWSNQYNLPGTYSAIATYAPMKEAIDSLDKRGYKYKVGQVLSSDNFYGQEWKSWAKMGILCLEMESYALYSVAAQLKKEALAILTISDSLLSNKETTAEQREKSFTNMMEVALDCIKE